MKIAYSFGIIDLLHIGHINVLREAKLHAELHVFGLVGDEAAREWMGSLLSDYEERRKVLEQISCIDEIVYQKTFDPKENLRQLHERFPDAEITLYHGNNWGVLPAEEYLKRIGGRVVLSQYYEKFSPENIRRLLVMETGGPRQRTSNLISTKADTLLALQNRLTKSRIEPAYVVTAGDFARDRRTVTDEIGKRYAGQRVVIRSSASSEDSLQSSNAGHYDSMLNIRADNPSEVSAAMESVLASYRQDNLLGEDEQILVQRQTENVMAGGVVFTRDLQRNRPYYLVNYEDNGSTDAVTSGSGGKSLWISRDTETLPQPWRSLIEAVREIERILDGMILDIEFAITRTGEVVIFQVRPLAANYRCSREFDDEAFYAHRQRVRAEIRGQNAGMDGEVMIFSDMAFWNPSEMIGVHPHELDYSLYREIITKRAWNEGLVPMGYRRVDRELMVRFSGKPYISVDYAFESLIPAVLSNSLSEKLVRFYKKKLREDLTAHDKIEFEIVYSCYDFTTVDKLERLTDEGFYIEECQELQRALRELTLRGIQRYFEVLKQDGDALKRLDENRRQIERKLRYQEENTSVLLKYFTTMIDGIKQYGTPQFARQARYAFMARSLCNSLVEKGYVSRTEMDAFMRGIETVSTDFARDMDRYLDGTLTREEFCGKYGHLRSGTYDIRAPRYEQLNFQPRKRTPEPEPAKPSAGLPPEALEAALSEAGFDGVTPAELTRFMRTAFEQRERFKFDFTKSLSLALEILRMIGRNLKIQPEELSYLQMADILAAEYYGSGAELIAFWRALIRRRQELRKDDALLVLPDVLTGAEDVDVVYMREARPNFITEKTAAGPVVALEQIGNSDLSGKIVLLEKADPGYDWIFSQNIAGLITCYGGAASHIAIRCAEFGIPAAIGCGKRIYGYVRGLESVLLDARHGKVAEVNP